MSNTVLSFGNGELPAVDCTEVLRYMGAREMTAELADLIDDCIAETLGELTGRVCYAVFPIRRENGVLDLSLARTDSKSLQKALLGCGRAVVFAATLGLGIDRLIARYSRLQPTRALCIQAIGSERIEAVCDAFCKAVETQLCQSGERLRPRFSPGYGDLPLELQRDIFRVLDCPRRIGLSLNETLMMSPTKSVTAIVGIGKEPQ